MTIEQYKETVISDYESPAWRLLERIAKRMNERGIFIDWINGSGRVEDQHDGKQVKISTVYRHNGTAKDISVKLMVDEWANRKYFKYADIKISEGASDKIIERRIDKVIEVLGK